MFTRDFNWKVKALSEEGAFSGIASPYGDPPDLTGDVIEPGAYRQAIAQQGKGYPLLFAHKQDQPIGLARIEDSRDALLVHGQLLMEDSGAQRVYAHLKMGSLKGISIGYRVPQGDGKVSYRNDGARVLREIHLHEISVVAVPAAPQAQITSVKSLGDVRHLLKNFRDNQVDDDAISDLQEIDRELKRLLFAPEQKEYSQTIAELKEFSEQLRKG